MYNDVVCIGTFNFINSELRHKSWSDIFCEFLECKWVGKHVSVISKFETDLEN